MRPPPPPPPPCACDIRKMNKKKIISNGIIVNNILVQGLGSSSGSTLNVSPSCSRAVCVISSISLALLYGTTHVNDYVSLWSVKRPLNNYTFVQSCKVNSPTPPASRASLDSLYWSSS